MHLDRQCDCSFNLIVQYNVFHLKTMLFGFQFHWIQVQIVHLITSEYAIKLVIKDKIRIFDLDLHVILT